MEIFIFYIKQGFFHVLDFNALDHVLFFIALTIVFSFKEYKKTICLITFFTIGHSLTFGLAAYNYLNVNVDLIEFLIPITILIPLVLNIYFAIKKTEIQQNKLNIYFSFFFGLIHGLGFSNYFKMLLDETDDKLIPLIEFAIGIEFAQLIIVLLVLIFSYLLDVAFGFKKRIVIITTSILIILFIIPMLIERTPWF
ncbi:MAG TPA: HupE/UreJ family protein [Bacteroidia bacterium]|nr:HupE/UreJ family protein [Bacteroidia bacterium]